ncbi:Organic cation/carnitine transporter 3 [Dorcoceras hygrometricum]|uniref:Organic cation/carnitine transporter 3 n=1 Tax=Dorcoceras hygrometricum TaxID=472368 RepID=A0A2Z7BFL0_9LAMI|nr:Organic cation/carnitine transporter 3 [Dorcoceras hygrometricum]
MDPNTPLHHNDPPETPARPKHHRYASLDDTLEYCVGDFGWMQFLQTTLVSIAWFFDAQQVFISIFTDAEPKWSCNLIDSTSTYQNITFCGNKSNICQLPKDAWSWDFPAHTSIISEWSLECAGSVIMGLPASSFFLGCLAGGFTLATLADSSLGRKNMLVLSCLLMSVTGLLTAFSTNVWVYAGLRFLSGLGRSTIGTCALVLAAERVGKRWREKVGILGFIYFTLGFLSLPALAFILEGFSWRLMYIWTCSPAIIYSFFAYFLVKESPRWLFIRGRKDEFAATLRSIASSVDGSNLTESFIDRCIQWPEEITPRETDMYAAMKILLKKRWALRQLLAVMVVGFGIGLIYYGMPLGLGNLSFDLYWSVTLNALSEFPASLVTFFLIGKLNRKVSVMGLSMLSGICSVGCVFVSGKGLQIWLELVSFFSACTAFNVVLIYTLELFPTCVRNSAVSMVRQALVVGGVLSPVLVAAGRKKGFMSYGVFGVTISLCCLFVSCLPETRGRKLCDSMGEEEQINEV